MKLFVPELGPRCLVCAEKLSGKRYSLLKFIKNTQKT
jgi:hypothetical protein